jgi:hypothetical protein
VNFLYGIIAVPLVFWWFAWWTGGGKGRELGPHPVARPPVYRCHGHIHHSQAAVDRCPIFKTWLADYNAGLVDYEGNHIPQPGELRACPKCNRNHFAGECPPAGHRVTDGRTGEVVGHWVPGS